MSISQEEAAKLPMKEFIEDYVKKQGGYYIMLKIKEEAASLSTN